VSWRAGLVAGVAIAAGIAAGCGATMHPRRITGTCGGACDYYLSCKHQPDPQARVQCVRECHDMFSDEKSLKELETLPCKDMIEFVDGTSPQVSSIP